MTKFKSETAWMIAAFVFAAGFFLLLGQNMAMKQAVQVAAPAAPTQAGAPTPAAPEPEIVDLGDVTGNTKGPADADITIVEFSDFECPFCGRALPTLDEIMSKHDSVKVIYKHLPLPFHPNARPAAIASECAGDQGKFWEYHDLLFENQQALGNAALKQYAVDLGLDEGKFNECLDSEKHGDRVDADAALAQKLGATGTPTFFINGRKLVGAQPAAEFERVISTL